MPEYVRASFPACVRPQSSRIRAPKTHEVNRRALKYMRKMFESTKLAELTTDDIRMHARRRLKQQALVKTKAGFVEKQVMKATTVHQELRMVRRMLLNRGDVEAVRAPGSMSPSMSG